MFIPFLGIQLTISVTSWSYLTGLNEFSYLTLNWFGFKDKKGSLYFAFLWRFFLCFFLLLPPFFSLGFFGWWSNSIFLPFRSLAKKWDFFAKWCFLKIFLTLSFPGRRSFKNFSVCRVYSRLRHCTIRNLTEISIFHHQITMKSKIWYSKMSQGVPLGHHQPLSRIDPASVLPSLYQLLWWALPTLTINLENLNLLKLNLQRHFNFKNLPNFNVLLMTNQSFSPAKSARKRTRSLMTGNDPKRGKGTKGQ